MLIGILICILAAFISATRPPVEETASFLNALLNAHGKDFFVLVFGEKGKNSLKEMGGVNKVAVAFSRKFLFIFINILKICNITCLI